jgi:hypothetical protein
MATGIDVLLTGLMLISLNNQQTCPKGQPNYPNTAWVVKADGTSRPCGWNDTTMTTLELRFNSSEFIFDQNSKWSKDNCKAENDGKEIICSLSEKKICFDPDPKPTPEHQRLNYASLRSLPRIDEVDRRFKEVLPSALDKPSYVPTRIQFPTGIVSAGEKWPPARALAGKPRFWFRSDGGDEGALPRELSDRVRITYAGATKLKFVSCDNQLQNSLIELTRKVDWAQATIQNRADVLHADEVGRFDNLSYLLWYYRLGSWESGSCPEYTQDKKDAVLLSCLQRRAKRCAYYPPGDRPSTIWPPFMCPDS